MSQAFIIMQIGNPDLDRVCEQVIVPALKACGLDPKRADKHNKGGLLKSEIVEFIKNSDIIIADLANARPNCYLEVGYAMGLGKHGNLILTACEDHNPDSPNHRKDGPKIHFDLIGYDILFWDPNEPDQFCSELQKRIKRRQREFSANTGESRSVWDMDWFNNHRTRATEGLGKGQKRGFVESRFALSEPKPNKSVKELLEASRGAGQVHLSFIQVTDKQGHYARPMNDGIIFETPVEDNSEYAYWALRCNGDFFLLQSFLEDEREDGEIFFDFRIAQVAELLLFCFRLYTHLALPDVTNVNVGIRHSGLKGRLLSSTSNQGPLKHRRLSMENEVYKETQSTLIEIKPNLVAITKEFTQPLFILFDYLELPDSVYSRIVNRGI